jgi:hypothetical protein
LPKIAGKLPAKQAGTIIKTLSRETEGGKKESEHERVGREGGRDRKGWGGEVNTHTHTHTGKLPAKQAGATHDNLKK